MRRTLNILGYALCTVPAAISVLEYFPLWVESGEKCFSAFALLLMLVSALPVLRALRRHLKTPSALVFWLLLFLFLCAFRSVIDELFVISLIALVGSVPGTVCLFIAKRIKPKK